jgi:hypothetical protein
MNSLNTFMKEKHINYGIRTKIILNNIEKNANFAVYLKQ